MQTVFKQLPLVSTHSKARGAAEATQAAHLQGKFWEMHDKLFENQREIGPEKYLQWAGEIGLDLDRFKRDIASDEVKKKVSDDMEEAAKLGVSGTPGFFINGRYLSGAKSFEAFKVVIDEELKKG